ncbi:hypothetical protein DQ812_23910 [Salmonella enterica subsp. enterica]|nr:hypothetical protein [Salmonella enterica subsp. enterica]MLO39845.1 hypothetical protein [Salmonella enterica subsp. enterica serovar Goverdhan]
MQKRENPVYKNKELKMGALTPGILTFYVNAKIYEHYSLILLALTFMIFLLRRLTALCTATILTAGA